MCRIASLFLLQRLKGSMSCDARDFNNIEKRAVIKSSRTYQHPSYSAGRVRKTVIGTTKALLKISVQENSGRAACQSNLNKCRTPPLRTTNM